MQSRLVVECAAGELRVSAIFSNFLITAADHLCTRVSRNLSREEWRIHIGDSIPYERTCPDLPAGGGKQPVFAQ